MKEKHTTIRVHMNPKDATSTLGHTLDKKFRNRESHVLEDGEFEIFLNKGVYETYKEVFGEALDTYNRNQKRKHRRILDENGDAVSAYIEQLMSAQRGKRTTKVEKTMDDGQKVVIGEKESNGTRILYEFILSVGNCNKELDDRGQVILDKDGHEIQPWRMPAEVSKRALKVFTEEFETKYKQLRLCYSVYHGDEYYYNDAGVREMGIEHGHIGVVPVGEGYKRGLSVQQSMRRALDMMKFKNGVDDSGVYHTAYWHLCDAMQKDYEEILRKEYSRWLIEKGMEPELLVIEHPARGKNLPNLSPAQYRRMKDMEAKARSMSRVYEDIEDALTEADEVAYEMQMLRKEISDTEQKRAQMHRDIEQEEERAREELQLKMEEMQRKHNVDMEDLEEERQLVLDANAKISEVFVDGVNRLKQSVAQTESKVDAYVDRVDALYERASISYSISDEHLLAWMRSQTTRRDGQKMSYLEAYERDIKVVMRQKARTDAEKVVAEMKNNNKDILEDIAKREGEAKRRQAEMLSCFDFDDKDEEEEGDYER